MYNLHIADNSISLQRLLNNLSAQDVTMPLYQHHLKKKKRKGYVTTFKSTWLFKNGVGNVLKLNVEGYLCIQVK